MVAETSPEVASIVGRLTAYGGRVEVDAGGTPRVVPPADPFWREKVLAMRAELVAHREAVLAYYRGLGDAHARPPEGDTHPGKRCPECRCLVFTDDPAEVARCCPLVMCPLRIPDAAEVTRRNRAKWARKRKEERDGN